MGEVLRGEKRKGQPSRQTWVFPAVPFPRRHVLSVAVTCHETATRARKFYVQQDDFCRCFPESILQSSFWPHKQATTWSGLSVITWDNADSLWSNAISPKSNLNDRSRRRLVLIRTSCAITNRSSNRYLIQSLEPLVLDIANMSFWNDLLTDLCRKNWVV